jgi:hypothetical protein
MASAVATDKFATRNKVLMYHHAPAAAATEQSVKAGATTTTWQDMRDYEGFAVAAMTGLLVGTGMIELSIYAAEDSSGTNATEIKTTGAIAADAVGDWAFLECSAEEIAQVGEAAGYNLRYVAAYIDCNHNDDECEVVYILTAPSRAADALTAATTIA